MYPEQRVYERLRLNIIDWIRDNVDMSVYGEALSGTITFLYSEDRILAVLTGLESAVSFFSAGQCSEQNHELKF